MTLFIANLLTACGGGSSSTGAFSSGVTRTKLIANINQQEHSQVCKSVVNWIVDETSLDSLCTLSGIYFAEFVSQDRNLVNACQSIVDSCANINTNNINFDEPSSCILKQPTQLSNCQRSVEELDACLNDYLNLTTEFLVSLSCDMASNPQQVQAAAQKFASIPPSATCMILESECPGIFNNAKPAI